MPASRGQYHGRLHQPGRQPTDRRTIFSNRKNPHRYHPRIGSSPPRQTLEFAVEASEKETAESIERSVVRAPLVLAGVWSLLRAEPLRRNHGFAMQLRQPEFPSPKGSKHSKEPRSPSR